MGASAAEAVYMVFPKVWGPGQPRLHLTAAAPLLFCAGPALFLSGRGR